MKRILSVLLIVLSAFSAVAQDETQQPDSVQKKFLSHYIVADLGGGLHFLNYDLNNWGDKKPGAGFMGRAGYRLFFGEHWGVGLDFNIKTYSTFATLNSVQNIDGALDEDNESYQHRTYFHDLKEQQKQTALSIPFGVYYQTHLGEKWTVVGGLGAFYQLQELSNKYSTTDGSLETRGYYSAYNVELYDMEQHNFYTAKDFEGDNTTKSCVGMFAEGQILYQIAPRLELGLGIYFSYGLNYQSESVTKNNIYNPDCMAADAYKAAKYNGVVDSKAIDKSSPLAVGGMVGIRYRIGKINKTINNEEIEQGGDRDTVVQGGDGDKIVVDSLPKEETPKEDKPSLEGEINLNPQGDPSDKDRFDDQKPDDNVYVIDINNFKRVPVNFDFNKTVIVINEENSQMFDAVAKVMKEHPNCRLLIVGHTCNIGTLQQNMIVGKRRAESCKKEIIKRGVEASRITTDSKAYKEPLVPNTSEENRKKNRRIEFTIENDNK